MPHQIELRDLTKSFGRGADAVDALGPVSLDVAEGEFVSLLGPSGCGKSTLMLMIAGLLPITQGSIQFAGKPVKGPQTDIGIMFQDNTLVPWRTVRGNIELQLEMRGLTPANHVASVDALLAYARLTDFQHHHPHVL
jgi:NitT/TauT family transport system ATP-binding protein